MANESTTIKTPNFTKRISAEGPFTTVSSASTVLRAFDVAEDQAVIVVATILAYTDDWTAAARFSTSAVFRRPALGDVAVSANKVDEVGDYNGNTPNIELNANVGTQQGEIIANGRLGENINWVIETLEVSNV